MAYIYCDACGIGFHSNVHSCPECGRATTRSHDMNLMTHGHRRRDHMRVGPLREDVENEVRESIYGWHSGTVELRASTGAAVPRLVEPESAGVIEPVQ